MLARSRSDFIAKRAALTAPTGFLPRLLLCSGLPRASLLTMIDRLGRLGDKAQDKEKVFNQLLVPSAASEWDIGRLGRRREVSRKMMGRLSAYSRMFQLSKLEGEDIISFTFLEWLSESCRLAEKPRKSKPKKEKAPSSTLFSSIKSAESILQTLAEQPLDSAQKSCTRLDGDASNMTKFRVLSVAQQIPRPQSCNDAKDICRFLQSTFEMNETKPLDLWLEENFGQPTVTKKRKWKGTYDTVPELIGESLPFLLLKSFSELERKTEGLGACIVKWVPKLSISTGSPELWKLLFADGQKPSFMWSNLISRCCQTWTHSHMSLCRAWVLSQGKEDLDLDKVVRFLVHSSSLGAIHVESFVEAPLTEEDAAWGKSEDMVKRASKLAIDCLVASEDKSLEERLCGRNDPPDSIVLLLLIARWGRKQLQCLSQTIVERMVQEDGKSRDSLLAVILRLYAYFPQSMNLGVAILRSVLKEAVEKYAQDWLSWRSPLDDEFQDVINSLIGNGAPPRMVQALAEGSKKHPLLLLRKLGTIEEALEADATVCELSVANEKRGVLYGQSLSGPIAAKVEGRLIKVTVKHWGFNFTENIWISFLDIISLGE
jgi:hypothetical protein